jgi:hypothetical protein
LTAEFLPLDPHLEELPFFGIRQGPVAVAEAQASLADPDVGQAARADQLIEGAARHIE